MKCRDPIHQQTSSRESEKAILGELKLRVNLLCNSRLGRNLRMEIESDKFSSKCRKSTLYVNEII